MGIFGLFLKGSGVALVLFGGLLLVSNPSQRAYENYASSNLSIYIKNSVCDQGEVQDFLASHCKSLVDISRPQLEEFIANKTTRTNFLLFSIYETNLSLFEPLPDYRFHTVGLLQYFYTYNKEEL